MRKKGAYIFIPLNANFYWIWGQNLVVTGLLDSWHGWITTRILVLGKNFKKWSCLFFFKVSTFKIGNKFGPPKSSMGTLFEPMILKNSTFLEFEAAISDWEVPQQHHLSQQHFGDHVAQKQHLLFLLPKIVDFVKIWKKSTPRMKIELWGGGEAHMCCWFVATEAHHRCVANL